MNYYQAREKSTDGEPAVKGNPTNIFHFTNMNDECVWPVGYCHTNNCQHKTAIEASDCYRDWCKNENNGKCVGGFKMNTNYGEDLQMISSY